jgi:hypothetical protein
MECERRSGWCGGCRGAVRVGEACCGEFVGWVGPDGLGWHDAHEYQVAVGAGRMFDARQHGSGVPDWILDLPGDVFLECVREADLSEVIQRTHDGEVSDAVLRAALRRLS